MPELPEVETVRRTLQPALGAVILKAWTSGQALHMNRPIPYAAIRRLGAGAKISGIRRRGKYLLLDLEHPERPDHVLLVHLGMTGRLRLHPTSEPRGTHTHLVWSLRRGRHTDTELRYSDIRRFGQLDLFPADREQTHPALSGLGVDPIEEELDADFVFERARSSGQMVKTFLLNQGVIAGIGNIYASEALWLARIRPTVRANRLSRQRAHELVGAVTRVLEHALEHGGTSLRDFVAADGAQGSHSDYLLVYGRDGEPCVRKGCAGSIRRIVIQGRATFHCPRCQDR